MTTPVLLMHMDGTNGSTIFTDSSASAHVVTTNGNAQVTTSDYKIGTGSLSLDGLSSLSIAYSNDFDFGSGAFTIELWVKFAGSTGVDLLSHKSYPAGWALRTQSGTNKLQAFIGSSLISTPLGGYNDSTWHHVALTRDEFNDVRLFVDGDLKATQNVAANVAVTAPLWIGRDPSGAALAGLIDEVRIIKGAAIYTANFTPPTEPFATEFFTVSLQYKNASSVFIPVTASLGDAGADITPDASKTAYWDNPSQDRPNTEVSDEVMRISAEPDAGNTKTYTLAVTSASQLTAGDGTGDIGDVKVQYAFSQVVDNSLLLHMDGSAGGTVFTDSSSFGHTVTPFGVTTEIAQKKFGTASARFADATDSLIIPNHDSFKFGTGNFTIEFWVYLTTAPANHTGMMSFGSFNGTSGSNFMWAIAYQVSGPGGTGWKWWRPENDYNNTNGVRLFTSVSLNTWTHIAIVRNGSTMTGYVNGVADGSGSDSGNLDNGVNNLCIGRWSSYNGFTVSDKMYLDEVRIVKKAVYTSNFTPPTTPFS